MAAAAEATFPENRSGIDDRPSILQPDGTLAESTPDLSGVPLLDLFRELIRTRTLNEVAMRLQRTGRIPYYYPCSGQEAHVAIPHALEDRDWIFPAYREQGVRLARGVPVINEMALFAGNPYASWDPQEYRITPINATIGTHIPHATGYGFGNRLLDRDEVALAIFGDGATSEVDFHAGLNFAGVWNAPTVFFCQNNGYAQSTPMNEQTASETLAQKALAYGIPGVRIDGMDVLSVYFAVKEAADRARSGNGATLIESVCYRFDPHSTYDGVPVYRTREEEAEWAEKDPLIRMRAYLQSEGLLPDDFEEQVTAEMKAAIDAAMDELDGQEMLSRQEMFESVQSRMTGRLAEQLAEDQKAAGEEVTVLPAERLYVPEEEAAPGGETRAMTLVEALNTELTDAMAVNDNMVILGEDVAREGGVFRVTAGLFDTYGRGRMMDTPLCELGIVGSAIGMAMAGVRPVCEIEFAGFTFTAYDQIIFHLARYHWRSNGRIRMPVVIRMPVAGGHEGLEGHCDSPEALFTHPPGLTVIYPSNAYDAKGLLASALQSEDPVIFFEPVAKYFVREKDIPVESYTIPIGKAKVVREGTDVTIVTYGNTVLISGKAAQLLADEGVSAEIIDLRSLKPWDEQCVLESVEKTGRLLVVHEAGRTGGMASEIITTVCEKACDLLETPPARVTHADVVWAPARLEPLSLITPQRIAAAARGVMED